MHQFTITKTTKTHCQLLFINLCMALCFSTPIFAGIEIERINLTTDSTPPNGVTDQGLTSYDGRYIAFRSMSTNLVKGGSGDLFVIDNQTKVVKRVLNGEIGASGFLTHISPSGRYLTFYSTDDNIVETDSNGFQDIFLADLQLNTINLVSVDSDENQANAISAGTSTVSNDGRYVAFVSNATNLVDGDTNGVPDLFIRDTQLGTTERISVSTAGAEADMTVSGGSISGDGRYVTYDSEATTLVAGDTAGKDVFLRDTLTDTTIKVNNRKDGTGASNGDSKSPVISADGRYIFFLSNSSTIDPRVITNYRYSIFKYDVANNISIQVSRDAPNNDIRPLGLASVSNDGGYIIYTSDAVNLVPDDTNLLADVFLTDTVNKTTIRANVDNEGNPTVRTGTSGGSAPWMISGDGNVVIFTSSAENLIENHIKGTGGVYVRNIQNETTDLAVSDSIRGLELSQDSYKFSASADGRYVTFAGKDLGLITSGYDTGDPQIFMLDRQTGIYTLITRGRPSFWSDMVINTESSTSYSSVFNDGQFVVFTSSSNYLVEGDLLATKKLFLYDIQADIISIIAEGIGTSGSLAPFAVSADGLYITFASSANSIVPGDMNNLMDVFLYNTQTKVMQQLSVSSTGVSGSADGHSRDPVISSDGKFVAFGSDATNLAAGDGNSKRDIFVRDIEAGETFRVSVNLSGGDSDNQSDFPDISENGRYVAFQSFASNLIASDTNANRDIFVRDRQTGMTTRANVDSNGIQILGGSSSNPTLSADGQYTAFQSSAIGLVEGGTNGGYDVFIHDNFGGSTVRVNLSASGEEANDSGYSRLVFTQNGTYLLFDSRASNLVPDDTNAKSDIFRVRNPLAPLPQLIFGAEAGSFEDP